MTEARRPFIPVEDPRPNDRPWGTMTWPPRVMHLSGDVVELDVCLPERDAEPLFHALNDDAVWRHITGRPNGPAAYAQMLEARQREGRIIWVVRLGRAYAGLDARAVVGASSYLDASPVDARLEIGATAYSRAVWGTKVNADAKLLLLSHAFDELGAGRVQFKTDVRNARSQRAIAKLGAQYEGTLRRSMRRDDGTVRDSVFFSIIAEEWPGVRAALIARLAAPEP